ncbi:MAG TPA: YMGG-like glycine zipper-containing protein [Bryobacteraceae bacterium]|nr:YMGG-like glycine zipper-containing protein [Bryobacteraceae bacterium]
MTPANAPHATVYLRDGTVVAGKVISSTPTQLEIAGDDNITHTIPVGQVQSMSYDAPPQAAAAAPPASTSSASSAPAPSAPAPPPPDSNHENHYHPPASAITTATYEVPSGTELTVRTEETIDSERASEGQTFPGELTHDVRDASGNVVIPRGANAQLVIQSESRGGTFRGSADLVLGLASVSVDGRMYQLDTSDVVRSGKEGVGKNRRTAKFAGGGAVFGAIIGAIAGGGKGAAIGAASGAGAGAAAQAFTKGRTIRVPAESILRFRLERPLHVVAAQ